MSTRAYITYQDYGGEKSTVSFHTQDITALNFLAITQNIDELRLALSDITSGTVNAVGFTRTFDDLGITELAPTDKYSQRETKWLVTMVDQKRFLDLVNTIANPFFGKKFSIEIPTANLDVLNDGAEEISLASNGPLVAAIETNLKSPSNAEAPAGIGDTVYVKVLSIRHVGRNI